MPDTVTILKAVADESRLRILSLVEAADDLCACEIEAVLGLNQSNASRHLTRLRHAGLLRGEKRGQWVHFSPNGETLSAHPYLEEILRSARRDLPAASEDLRRLHSYRQSGYSCRTIDEWASANPRVAVVGADFPRLSS
ncbi:MAG: ArsR/SmtB family transcription factor [Spirochaetaceae bacterium]